MYRTALFKDGEAPPALETFLPDMLFADATPEDVVVCEALPSPTYLRSAAEGSSVEVAEDLETDFARENGKRVDADEMGELLREQGELGEAAHGEETLEDECAAGVR